jgi:hypothetical protein
MLSACLLMAGCAVTGGSDGGEVEVGGRVLQDGGAVELAWAGWRDPDGGEQETVSADEAPADAVSLADGFEAGGQTWSVDDGGWVEVSSRVLDRQRPSLSADVANVGVDQGAAEPDDATREVTCRLELEAPAERGLQARGELYVELLVTGPDGQTVRAAHGLLSLDLGLAPGEVIVNEADHRHTVEQAEGTRVECAVTHEPA